MSWPAVRCLLAFRPPKSMGNIIGTVVLFPTHRCNGCSTASREKTRSRLKSIFGAPAGRCHMIRPKAFEFSMFAKTIPNGSIESHDRRHRHADRTTDQHPGDLSGSIIWRRWNRGKPDLWSDVIRAREFRSPTARTQLGYSGHCV